MDSLIDRTAAPLMPSTLNNPMIDSLIDRIAAPLMPSTLNNPMIDLLIDPSSGKYNRFMKKNNAYSNEGPY